MSELGRDHLPSVSLEVVHPCTSLFTPFRLPLEFLQECPAGGADVQGLAQHCPGPLSLRSMSLQGLPEQPFPHWAAELDSWAESPVWKCQGHEDGVRISGRAQQTGSPPLPKLLPWKPSATLETSKCCNGIALRLLLFIYSLFHSFLLPNKLRPGCKTPESS